MLTDKSLTDFTDLFSPKRIKDNDKIILHKKKKRNGWSTKYVSKWSDKV